MTTSRSKSKKEGKAVKPIPSNIKQRALRNFQRMRRLEEMNADGTVTCISCGRIIPFSESQGGHYISRTCEATCNEPDNVWPQCVSCNCYKDGNYIEYRMRLVRKIGIKRVERLENMLFASKGDEEALAKLYPQDQYKVTGKKGKVYWNERNEEYKRRIKELE